MSNFAERVQRGFDQLGIPLPGGSRLRIQIDAYLDRKGELPRVIAPEHRMFQAAVEGRRDLAMLGYVFEQLLGNVCEAKLKQKLLLVVRDPLLPQDSRADSRGRDTQFELFVAALCQRAGLSPTLEEPDIRCVLDGQQFGIAAKRIKTRANFRGRVAEGADQIFKSGLPGIVFIDVSQSVNPSNWRIPRQVSDAEYDHRVGRILGGIKRRFSSAVLKATQGKHVHGVIVLDHQVREHATRSWEVCMTAIEISLVRFNDRRQREFDAIYKSIGTAIRSPGAVPAT